ncbi:MAG: DUF3084 domain-containing protein [Synergistaceae bacterium]|nr:DUF3084 domain-containing protein [Synergistaceae bacterium]
MSELLSELNWSLLLTLLIVSAVVAWFGDIIGMKVGKKRITIFNLRPKYTTRLISVLTGVGIAFATLFVSATASESVRTAIFNMKYVKNQILNLTAELKTNRDNLSAMEYQLFQNQGELQQKRDKLTAVEMELAQGTAKLDSANKKLEDLEKTREQLEKARDKAAAEQKQLSSELAELKTNVKSLRGEADKLKANVRRLREDRIAAFSGEILAQGVVEDAKLLTDDKIDGLLLMLKEQCREMLAQRFGQNSPVIPEPEISEESAKQLRKDLKNSKGRQLVRLAAVSNAVYGEPVVTEASLYNSKQIYKKGELLSKIKFSGTETRSEIDTKIYNALRSVNQKAVNDGILRDPISGNVGSVESAELSNASKRIKEEQKPCTLEMRTNRDIYTEGPVTITLSVK